ncbi:glutamate ABC transporter substrate-binding protein [Arthrobacter sp. ISL-85]|uniref:glutamate ABC transporter substrate-binding protein n=1 Tax=Arthrobacter sp. ISL-85 TaxID=2819115 RepID=UPI001BEB6260|nr:glutamate ABC transporter substrate-binding protein [Arthrobacter sp. ISL-85]MBT2565104.1 glutamate ABC transporter substrate-binding protein [Arthrobacter sp. ISL-85]
MRPYKLIAAVSVAAAVVLTATACGTDSPSPEASAAPVAQNVSFPAGSTMDSIVKAGKLRIGGRFDHPGLSQKNLTGNLEGFEVAMVNYVAGQLGLKQDQVEWTETNSANREQFIQQDKVDMVVSTLSITDKRQQVISFAGPYAQAPFDLLIQKGNPKGIKDPLTPAGTKVCSTAGGAVSDFIRKTYPGVNLVEFDVSSKCIEALKNGQVDALSTQAPIGAGYVGEDKDNLEMLNATMGDPDSWGIGIKKGNTQFCEFLDKALTQFQADGSYQKAWNTYLGAAKEQQLPKLIACT